MKWPVALITLSLGLLIIAVACGTEGSSTPTATPTPPPATPTPTPMPTKEWSLESIGVDGSTVTVELRVFAGIDVQVALDGRKADEILGPSPTLRSIFRNVLPGDYTIRVSDVVGYVETAVVR